MVQIQAKSIKVIQLGHRGENEARQIIFDLADYISTYGPGTARLLHQRDGDPAPYIVPAVQSDTTLIWAVTDADTAAPGTGSAELQWTVNNVLAKSGIWNTKTKAALDDGATEPPTGAEGWYQQLVAYIDSLKGAGVSDEQIAAAVEAYLLEHPVNVPVTSVNGKIGAVNLTAEDVGALAQDDLPTAVNDALTLAKASGEFDGPQGPAGADGKDGADGQPGADGADGATPNIQIGTVETLPAGSAATASMAGTAENPLLNLGIPKGADGSGGSGNGEESPWRLIRDITVEEDVRTITFDVDDNGEPFEVSELYLYTNATNISTKTTAGSFGVDLNGLGTCSIGTTSPMSVAFGATGTTGRNWIWIKSLNPLIVLHGAWLTTNTASLKSVYCFQPDALAEPGNPHAVGEKISAVILKCTNSTSTFASGSRFLVYGR